MDDKFVGIFPTELRGRVRTRPRKRAAHEPREFFRIAGDCLARPQDPERIIALAGELRACWGDELGTRRVNKPLARYAVASLWQGVINRGVSMARAGGARTKSFAAVLELFPELKQTFDHVVVLYADLVGDNFEISIDVLASRGNRSGRRTGDELTRHRERVAEARLRLAQAVEAGTAAAS